MPRAADRASGFPHRGTPGGLDDDKYFAAAVEGSATLIVTGDPDLLAITEYQGVRVVTPRTFLDLLSR